MKKLLSALIAYMILITLSSCSQDQTRKENAGTQIPGQEAAIADTSFPTGSHETPAQVIQPPKMTPATPQKLSTPVPATSGQPSVTIEPSLIFQNTPLHSSVHTSVPMKEGYRTVTPAPSTKIPFHTPAKQGQKPPAQNTDKPDLFGEVSEIRDNEITLKLMEPPAFNRKPNNDNSPKPEGKDRNGMRQNGRSPATYTGEIKTVVLTPASLITIVPRGRNNTETNNLTIKDIHTGNILQVWYGDKDTVARVSVSTRGAPPSGENPY